MARGFIEADLSELGAAVGVMDGIVTTMKSRAYVDDVMDFAHNTLSRSFDYHMDALHAAAPSMFHHVYEWDSVGEAGMGRLWNHTFTGRGGTRTASWDWVASKKPIPTPAERAENSNDPMSQLDEDEIAKFSNRRYIFTWKAPIMEFDTPVTITPRNGKSIAFAVWDPEEPIRFSKAVRVENPGGDQTTGAFTAAWAAWWASEAPQVFDDTVQEVVEKDISEAGNQIRQTARTRTMQLSINPMQSYERGMATGRAAGRAALLKKSASYGRMGKR